jgi:hypothetical protein
VSKISASCAVTIDSVEAISTHEPGPGATRTSAHALK